MTHRGRDRPGEMWERGGMAWRRILGQKLGKRAASLAEHPCLPDFPSQSEELRGLSASVAATLLTEGEMHLAAESV
jgi:hypothetical protein